MASFHAARTDEKFYPDVSNLAYTNAFVSLAATAVAELGHTEDTNSSSLQKTSSLEIIPIQGFPRNSTKPFCLLAGSMLATRSNLRKISLAATQTFLTYRLPALSCGVLRNVCLILGGQLEALYRIPIYGLASRRKSQTCRSLLKLLNCCRSCSFRIGLPPQVVLLCWRP